MTSYAVRTLSRMGKFAPAAATTLPLALLACMANPALATPITLGTPTCGNDGSGGSGACTAAVINGAAGNSISATITSPFGSFVNGPQSAVAVEATANASGQLLTAQTLNLAYDFTVDRMSLGGDSLTYFVEFTATDTNCTGKGGGCLFYVTGVIPTGTGDYEVSGTQTFTLPAGTVSGTANIFLTVADVHSSKSSFSITSASMEGTNGTLTVPPAVTPEPASILLAGTGMALAALKRRRKSA